MTHEFAKYPDGTLGVFSNIGKEEKETFMKIVKNGSAFFFKYARLGGLEIA